MSQIRQAVHKNKKADPVLLYLKDISELSLLNRQEEIDLARRVQTGDKEAERKLVEGNLRFVVSVARRYKGQGIPLSDLINEGNIGLIKAAKKFDPSRGIKFITYASWWVKSSIAHAISKQKGVISLPFNHIYTLNKIERKREELSKDLGDEPSLQDLADSLDLSIDYIEKHLQASDSFLSLDSLISEDSRESFKDFLAEDDPVPIDRNIEKRDSKRLLEKLLNRLKPRQKKIIDMRFGLNGEKCLTLREVAERLNLSYERIRQIQKDSLRNLFHMSKQYL